MYKKGDLKLVDLPCETFNIDEDDYISCDKDYEHVHYVVDSRQDGYVKIQHPCVYLPHSCEEWVIGGPDQIEQLISDLKEALEIIQES